MLDDDDEYCARCGEYFEHCDCEPAILTCLEPGLTCHACRKPIKWGDLMQTWEEGPAHAACEWVSA